MGTYDPVVLTCAVTGGMTVPTQSEAIPVTPEEIVRDSLAAHEAGATVIHIHVRDPESGRPVANLDLFREVLEGVAERCDAILQPTTGGGAGMTIKERVAVVEELRPEMATLNAGSFNFGIFQVAEQDRNFQAWEREYLESTRDYVFRNTFADLEYVSRTMLDAGTKPEVEIYDVGHVFNLRWLIHQGLVVPPVQVQFVLGVLGANQPEFDQLLHLLRTTERVLECPFTWSVAGVGYPAEFQLAAAALTLGGNVRVGLEDNLRVRPRERAASNAGLVHKAVSLAELLDRAPATVEEARAILSLTPR